MNTVDSAAILWLLVSVLAATASCVLTIDCVLRLSVNHHVVLINLCVENEQRPTNDRTSDKANICHSNAVVTDSRTTQVNRLAITAMTAT